MLGLGFSGGLKTGNPEKVHMRLHENEESRLEVFCVFAGYARSQCPLLPFFWGEGSPTKTDQKGKTSGTNLF